ncbi:MAG: hypothetical protein ACO27F_04380 [Beijerinckiaceae bacterium]
MTSLAQTPKQTDAASLADLATRFPGESLRVIAADGVMTLASVNTTLGYCRYDATGEVEYVFVGAAFRRKGVASWLLARVAQETGRTLAFREPISPLGARLVAAWARTEEGAKA